MEHAGLTVQLDGHVAEVVLCRPPYNYLDLAWIETIAETMAQLDADARCRAIVLSATGKAFCAGVHFSVDASAGKAPEPGLFYAQAMRLFDIGKPIVAAVQGPAIGAGLGLAVAADFRVTCEQGRFSANFNRLGVHPGFGLSVTLPRLVGAQQAALLFYTGRRIDGAQAVRIGLADELTEASQVRARALALAQEIAASAPLAVEATRHTLRQEFSQVVKRVNARELEIQLRQFASEDFQEGVRAMAERRSPVFVRR